MVIVQENTVFIQENTLVVIQKTQSFYRYNTGEYSGNTVHEKTLLTPCSNNAALYCSNTKITATLQEKTVVIQEDTEARIQWNYT